MNVKRNRLEKEHRYPDILIPSILWILLSDKLWTLSSVDSVGSCLSFLQDNQPDVENIKDKNAMKVLIWAFFIIFYCLYVYLQGITSESFYPRRWRGFHSALWTTRCTMAELSSSLVTRYGMYIISMALNHGQLVFIS